MDLGSSKPGRGEGARYVYEALQKDILTLTLAPGSLLDETLLAKRFGLSRSPIREALVRLSAEGLVVMLANRSTLVAPIELVTFPKYVEALDLLQRINTRLAAELRSETDLLAMERAAQIFERAAHADDHLAMSATNKDFHMAIASGGKNPYLAREYGVLLDEGRRILHLHFQYLASSAGEYLLTDEHQAMIEAIRQHDVEEADRLAHDHTRQFRDRFLRFMQLNHAESFALDSVIHDRGEGSRA